MVHETMGIRVRGEPPQSAREAVPRAAGDGQRAGKTIPRYGRSRLRSTPGKALRHGSLAEHPGTMTHSDIPPARQAELGITPAMVRLSVGVEHPEDLIADLAQALEAV